jgi:hypothetical protein
MADFNPEAVAAELYKSAKFHRYGARGKGPIVATMLEEVADALIVRPEPSAKPLRPQGEPDAESL